jgi:hypothetical protein
MVVGSNRGVTRLIVVFSTLLLFALGKRGREVGIILRISYLVHIVLGR